MSRPQLTSTNSTNTAQPSPATTQVPKRHHRLRWTLLTVGGLLAVFMIVAGWLIYRAISIVNTRKLDGSSDKLSFFQQLTHLVASSDQQLQGEREDRINILLLGIGGPGHEGPYLTDTMMVASIKPSTKQVALLSIPRDLVVNIPGYDYRKINNVLAIGRERHYPGGGDALAVKVVSSTLDLPIQYYARIDFRGFEEIIDRLGGIKVDVARAFTDREYPTTNFGYQAIRFNAGSQTMNGDAALKYARSRHGNNGEGSDFARAARQQKILLATRDKALSLGTIINPKKVADILGSLGAHHQTNLEVWEMIRLAKLVGDVNQDTVITKVLDNSPTGLLTAAVGQAGAYILVPKDDGLGDIRFLAHQIFLIGLAEREQVTVVVANATRLTGLADATTKRLAGFGITVASPLSIRGATIGRTVLLDRSQGQAAKTIELVGLYARAQGSISLAEWQQQTGDETLAAALQTVNTPGEAGSGLPGSRRGSAGNTPVNAPPTKTVVLILGQDQQSQAAARLDNNQS
ncbi:MAG: LCP family protein [Candidatus Kerfeldbacteria bacterium]|nr:LCP family protein [Candidatus Kerfeldbacteria bacterium]